MERLLKSIQKQTYQGWEIIVVDNNSKDLTKKVALKFTNKVFDKGPERSAQRNFGAKKAKGSFLLFLDADMRLSPNLVKQSVNLLKSDQAIGAATILEKSVARTFWEKVKAYERSFYNLEGDSITDAARFFPRKIFETTGGYDESITGPEDWDLTDKVKALGYKIGVCRELIYHYERVPNPLSVAKKKYYYGIKSHRYFKKQNVPIFSPKTIYFLRPIFYKNWRKLLVHPILTLGMVTMMTLELIGGGLGFLVGKFKNA